MLIPRFLSRRAAPEPVPPARLPLLVAILRDGQDVLDIVLPPATARAASAALCGLHATWYQHARRPFHTGTGDTPSADETSMVTLFNALTRDNAAHTDALLLWMLRPAGRDQARLYARRLARALDTIKQ